MPDKAGAAKRPKEPRTEGVSANSSKETKGDAGPQGCVKVTKTVTPEGVAPVKSSKEPKGEGISSKRSKEVKAEDAAPKANKPKKVEGGPPRGGDVAVPEVVAPTSDNIVKLKPPDPPIAAEPKAGPADANLGTKVLLGREPAEEPEPAKEKAAPELTGGERLLSCKPGTDPVQPASLNMLNGGKPNYLRTTQFTPITWLPKSLYNQFKRIANIYFLFIACIVVAGSTPNYKFSPKDWKSKIGPFVFVLLWSACKDLYEDLRRRADDKKENTKVTKRYDHAEKTFVEVCWSDILVGDLVYVPCDGSFPADVVLIKAADDADDTAFISTVMLDGETNLKERSVPKVFSDLAGQSGGVPDEPMSECLAFVSKFMSADCEFKMGAPDPVLSDVRGLITLRTAPGGAPLGEANFLPRGCILRNTRYIFGVVAYVGEDTKTRLNATEVRLKFSRMQQSLNLCIRLLLCFIFFICTYATIMEIANAFGKEERKWPWYIMFLRFCIAYYHAVPMSLYVVYEMLKLVLGYHVGKDEQMFCDGEGAVARTADLMEEMGQVDFIFSDKTGTLTANEMVFARCHVQGQDLGEFRQAGGHNGEGFVKAKSVMGKRDGLGEAVAWFFTCLATCHEVVLELPKDHPAESAAKAGPTYSGMSPDEVALVNAARDAGLVLERRSRLPGGVIELEVRDNAGTLRKYEVPTLIAFTSDRKRMSVILKCEGKAWVVTKGADSVLEPLITGGFPEAAKHDVDKFSKIGLRVLAVATRELSAKAMQDWLAEYQQARSILDNSKEAKVREVVAKLEQGLTFAGLTAVEDRLQDGVPEAIETVKKAGSRVWVLTGDKTETAVNIAYSCALFTETTKLAYIVGKRSAEEAKVGFQKAMDELQGATDAGIVIDGGTLVQALGDQECRVLIFTLGMASQSCICTRLSPMQKLQLVQLVREADAERITLAIGDGANDVPMILGGHVGIGIRGKEGAAAVQVCDVAISQFRFLVPLLLCHGRRAYRRVAIFFCYYIYKNMVLLMADLVWMHWDNFNGRIAFPEYLSIAFNAFFTSWHVLFVLGFDKDVPDEVSNTQPDLYKVGPQRRLFNAPVFLKWMFFAFLHGAVAWLVPFIMIGTKDYYTSTFWTSSCCAFTNVVHITIVKSIIMSENPFHWMTLAPAGTAWIMFVVYLSGLGYTGLGNTMQPQMKNIPGTMFTAKAFTTIAIAPLIALSIDVVERIVQRYVFPTELQKAEFAAKAKAALQDNPKGKE